MAWSLYREAAPGRTLNLAGSPAGHHGTWGMKGPEHAEPDPEGKRRSLVSHADFVVVRPEPTQDRNLHVLRTVSNPSNRRSPQTPPRPAPGPSRAPGAPPHDARARHRAAPPARSAPGDEPHLESLDELDAPPISGKVHPSADLSDVIPTLDDEVRDYHHHPNEPGAVGFDVSPYSADAAADMAGDLGSEFLEGATRGQDMSDLIMSRDDAEGELPFVIDTVAMDEPSDDDEEPLPRLTPRRAR